MLSAAAVCPHPPLLIPGALGAAAADPPAWWLALAQACDDAVAGLAAAAADLIVVVGGGPRTREFPPGSAGSLAEFGVPVTVGTGEPVLPLSLTVGRWLLRRARIEPAGPAPVLLQAVDTRATPQECRKLGAELAGRAGSVALLALGDSSARPAREAPGVADPAAREYDDEVAEALAAADARWLGRLDPALDEELLVAGRAAWQVLAGAAAGTRFHGRLRCMMAPHGVTYLVASWDQPPAG